MEDTASEQFKESIDTLLELLEKIWRNLDQHIGEKATLIFFRNVCIRLKQEYPFLESLIIDRRGVNTTIFKKNLANYPLELTRESLIRFIDNLISDITRVAGPIILEKIPLEKQID